MFSKPEKVYKTDENAITFFKSYGVNLFGQGFDKKSIIEKLNWIENNEEEILNYENGNENGRVRDAERLGGKKLKA